MSKFIDKLNSIVSGGPAPMGFRAAGAKPRPKMLLVAHNSGAKFSGADAVLLSFPKGGIKPPKALSKSDIPWGGWLKDVTSAGVKKLGEGGADFIVFAAASVSKAVLAEEKMGKVIEVEADIEAGLLKSVDGLPVDAVLIAGEKSSLSWQDLMLFRRAASVLSKPLLVTVSPQITSSELQALCEAGVSGVVAGEKWAELRPMIDKLVPAKAAKRRNEPLVPHISSGTGAVAEEEDEDDED